MPWRMLCPAVSGGGHGSTWYTVTGMACDKLQLHPARPPDRSHMHGHACGSGDQRRRPQPWSCTCTMLVYTAGLLSAHHQHSCTLTAPRGQSAEQWHARTESEAATLGLMEDSFQPSVPAVAGLPFAIRGAGGRSGRALRLRVFQRGHGPVSCLAPAQPGVHARLGRCSPLG